jgi:hypothetical protein
LTPLNFDGLRSFLRPELTGIPAEDIEQIVNTSISEMAPGTAEDFMKALGSVGKAVGPTLQRAAPGMAQGAATGATMGGPWGALIGAGAGLASSAFRKQGRPPSSAVPAPGVTIQPPATVATPPTSGPALPTGQAAAATLLGILQNPTVQQALVSQVLGASGKQQVSTPSGGSLPRGAINSLLMQLLANATEGLVESESISEQEYLHDASGEYMIDPASPEQQAALVLSHLQSGTTQFPESNTSEFAETVEWIAEFDGSESEDWLESDESSEMVRFY